MSGTETSIFFLLIEVILMKQRWDYGMEDYPLWKKVLAWAFVLALPFVGSIVSVTF